MSGEGHSLVDDCVADVISLLLLIFKHIIYFVTYLSLCACLCVCVCVSVSAGVCVDVCVKYRLLCIAEGEVVIEGNIYLSEIGHTFPYQQLSARGHAPVYSCQTFGRAKVTLIRRLPDVRAHTLVFSLIFIYSYIFIYLFD